jgi:hypothetical protein
MKINKNYKIREIAGEMIVVKHGKGSMDMTRVVSLNRTARVLYEALVEKEFTVEDVARVLIDRYGIGAELAAKDAEKWVEALKRCRLI